MENSNEANTKIPIDENMTIGNRLLKVEKNIITGIIKIKMAELWNKYPNITSIMNGIYFLSYKQTNEYKQKHKAIDCLINENPYHQKNSI